MISVLLPFTDERGLLKDSIDSLLRQSYRDFELLLIDNADDATTVSIAEEASREDSRCKLLHENRKGISHALNHGLRQAAGKFIARMDADDIAHPDRLKHQSDYLEHHPEIGVLATRTTVEPSVPGNEGFRLFVAWQNEVLTAGQHAANRFIESPIAHPSVMARSELFEIHGTYSTDPLPEDYELWLRWMNAGVRFEKLPEVLLTWRDRNNRLSRTHANYSEESFLSVKAKYLKKWWEIHVDQDRPVIVCGGSRHIRERIERLQLEGIPIAAVTDVVPRSSSGLPFIPVDKLADRRESFVINLISKRDVRESIRKFLTDAGFLELQDFIMAG